MKLATFSTGVTLPRPGLVEGTKVIDLGHIATDLAALIKLGSPGLARAAAEARSSAQSQLDQVRLHVPLFPTKVLCSGLNYRSHVEENPQAKFLGDPRFFAKLPNTIIGPGEPIVHPGSAYCVDYEVELAVVIGQRMLRGTPVERVMAHVFGYTILHDVSARFIQFKDNNETMGKNFDTFCPIGPWIVTADEIPNPAQLRLRTRLNGELVQDGSNTDWCFPLSRLLAWLSQAMTLEPGDIVSTGTPSGIGWFRKPQIFLKPGDVVRLEIDGIGALENPVVAAKDFK